MYVLTLIVMNYKVIWCFAKHGSIRDIFFDNTSTNLGWFEVTQISHMLSRDIIARDVDFQTGYKSDD